MLAVHFTVSSGLGFQPGFGLVLRLSTAGSMTTCTATNPATLRTDPLTDLVRALRHFSGGMPDVSCRWPDDHGGHFLDVSRIDDDRCAITVQSFALPRPRPAASWLPQRGELRFGANLPASHLVSAFITAFQRLRAEHGHDFGVRWPWPFPQIELSRLTAAQ